MSTHDWRAAWIGAGVAIVASVLLAVLAASFESTINGPGTRNVAPPVLWAVGGGVGLAIGAFLASCLTQRWWPGAQAAFLGGLAFLILVIVAYNDKSLRLEDQVVGTLLIVVVPPVLVALGAAWLGKLASRLVHRYPA